MRMKNAHLLQASADIIQHDFAGGRSGILITVHRVGWWRVMNIKLLLLGGISGVTPPLLRS
jgi:hypothetical protein